MLPAIMMLYMRKPLIMASVSRPAITSRPPYHMIAAIDPNPRNIMTVANNEFENAMRTEAWNVFRIARP